MTRDRSDAVIVRLDPVRGSPRRYRFEPRRDGDWTMVDEVWTGCTWRSRGREVMASIGFENVPPELVTPIKQHESHETAGQQ